MSKRDGLDSCYACGIVFASSPRDRMEIVKDRLACHEGCLRNNFGNLATECGRKRLIGRGISRETIEIALAKMRAALSIRMMTARVFKRLRRRGVAGMGDLRLRQETTDAIVQVTASEVKDLLREVERSHPKRKPILSDDGMNGKVLNMSSRADD